MEIDFWQYLVKDGALGLKQHVPEVAVFEGENLAAWLHTSARGSLTRIDNATIDDFQDKVLNLADERLMAYNERVGPNTPAAILRKLSINAGSVATPVAVVLTVQELDDFLNKVRRKMFDPDMDGVFTLQHIVLPKNNIRIVCTYSCDARGEEKTDIFGRTFEQVYPLNARIDVPTAEDIDKDQCLPIVGTLRDRIESRVLALVRFVAQSYTKSVDAMVVEFIEDVKANIVLHGFWAITTFIAHRPILAQASGPVRADHNIGVEDFQQGSRGRPFRDMPADENPEIPKILLEVWSKDTFLGESWTPPLDQFDGRQHPLTLMRVPGSRRDPRKETCNVRGTVDMSARWVNSVPFGGPVHFVLLRATNLKRTEQASRPRVILWLCASGEFSPLWSSKPGSHPINPQFQEAVDFRVPCGSDNYRSPSPRDSPRDDIAKDDFVPSRPGGAPKARPMRPTSACGRLESRKRSGSVRSAAVERVQGKHRTISHWGAETKSEEVSTHVLCSQIISRFSTERQNRSQMLSVLARQLERYRDVQNAAEEQRKAVHILSLQFDERMEQHKIDHQAKDTEMTDEIAALRARLGAMYKEMTNEVQKGESVSEALEQDLCESRTRERHHLSTIESLESQNASLREALDKTLDQLNELKSLESEGRPPASPTGKNAKLREANAREAERELRQQLCDAQAEITRLQDSLGKERAQSAKVKEQLNVAVMSPRERASRADSRDLAKILRSI